MLINLLIFISLVISASYAEDIITGDEILSRFDVNNLCENKIMAVLSAMKTETDRKLEALEKHLAENFEETINRKIYALEYKIPDRLEEILDRKMYKLERKLLDKLEEFMNDKLHTVEKKMDALEKKIPNDMDGRIENLNFNIDTLKKRMTDLQNNVSYQLNEITNKTAEKNIHDDIQKPNTVKTEICNLQNDTVINCKRDILDDKIVDIAENISRKVDSLKNMIPDIEENIKSKLNMLDIKISEKLDETIIRQLKIVEKTNVPESKDTTNKSQVFESTPEKTEQSIDHKLDATHKITDIDHKLDATHKIPEIDHKLDATQKIPDIDHKLDATQKNIPEIDHKLDATQKKIPEIDNPTNKSNNMWDFMNFLNFAPSPKYTLPDIYDNLHCKERVVRGYNFKPLYRIDNETLNHVKLNRTAEGNVTYFEMHFAIKAARDGLILLSPELDPSESDRVFELCIGISNNQRTELRQNLMRNSIGGTTTPNILSPAYYVAFYIIIDNGNLELGREDSGRLVIYKDELLNSVKYFSFASWDDQEANFLYDCPASREYNPDPEQSLDYGTYDA